MSNNTSKVTAERAERAVKVESCVTQALINGCKGAAWALATAGIIVSAANKYSPTFQKALGVSGKAGLVVSDLTSTLTAREKSLKFRNRQFYLSGHHLAN